MHKAANDIAPSEMHPPKQSVTQALSEISELLGERATSSESVLRTHGKGASWYPMQTPDVVCYPHSTEEVARIVKICAHHRVPVIPFGAGTSLEGHVLAPVGGVSIDLTQMNSIIAVNENDMDCRVQAGVTRKQLNQWLRDTGLFFPIDPGADATIGGMTSTRASGTNAVRYGTMRENVMSLTFVNAQGEIVQTGTRSRKSSAGYDLTRLLVGAEGTLGVITEIGLRLYGLPEAINAAVVSFPDLDSAVKTVIDTMRLGIPIARIELIDARYMAAINAYSKSNYAEKDTLFLEFHGTEQYVSEQIEQFREISSEYDASDFQWAANEEERNRLWQARHDAYWAILAKYPGKEGIVTDICVPISNLAQIIEEVRRDLDASPLDAEILGHVGDGNFHMVFCVEPDDSAQVEAVMAFHENMVVRALELGGTCTGEHGVGVGKLKYLRREHGDPAVAMMSAIKQALDPDNILNPGKTVPLK